jgi:hypothetical protein
VRTTLDLDERAVVAAKARARARGITIGAAASELMLAGLDAEEPARRPNKSGLVLLPSVPGHVITSEMVADALAED